MSRREGSLRPWEVPAAATPTAGSPGGGRFPAALWLPLALLLGGGLLGVLAPRVTARPGAGPDPLTLLSVGLVLTAFTGAALYLGLRWRLKLPARVLATAFAYNALIVVVKFTLAPHGLYEVNRTQNLTGLLGRLDEPAGALIAAGLVFLLYAGVYTLIRRWARKRLEVAVPSATGSRTRTEASTDPEAERLRRRRLLLLMLVGVAVVATGGGALAILVVPLLFASVGLEYLAFVFGSGMSLVIAVLLALAVGQAVVAFKAVGDEAEVARDATLLVTFFWFGLALIAVYHVLWVVYILVLASIWPLKVVVPK